jgi:hypothetical protein
MTPVLLLAGSGDGYAVPTVVLMVHNVRGSLDPSHYRQAAARTDPREVQRLQSLTDAVEDVYMDLDTSLPQEMWHGHVEDNQAALHKVMQCVLS